MSPTADERPWFEPLVRALERPALAFAVMMVRDRSTAEEILQEAFVRVWESPNTPSEEAEFRRWLYRTITNLARDHMRRQARFASLPRWIRAPANPLDVVDRRLEDQELVQALRRLTPREQLGIYVRFYEDRPLSEVDQMLGGRPGTGRKLVSRAVEKLRKRLPTGTGKEATV